MNLRFAHCLPTPKIRELILAQEILFFWGKRNGLFWSESGKIGDLRRPRSILDLFNETLRQLRQMT